MSRRLSASLKLTSVTMSALAISAMLATGQARASQDVMVVYDASGSMWGQIDGVTKIEIARDVMADFLEQWPAQTKLGLVAYGHRREKDCRDIETLIKPGAVDRSAFMNTVNDIRPRGRTPLSAAVEHAANALSYRENPATVVLISDGMENCQADPCAVADKLARQGVGFTAHVIGFDINDETKDQLMCIAQRTGGQFVAAKDAAQLQQAMMTVQSEIEKQAEQPGHSEPKPADNPVPAKISVDLVVPESVVAGSRFDVQYKLVPGDDAASAQGLSPSDRVAITPKGATKDTPSSSRRIANRTELTMTAPAEAGVYEVRYVQSATQDVAGSALLEVRDPDISLTVAEQAVAGERFDVQWSQTVNPMDRIGVVPEGTEQGQFGNYLRVRDNSSGKLTAPSEPGLYEIRYILNEASRTVASVPIEIVAGDITLQAPESVNAGSRFQLDWSKTINQNDFVTIVPRAAKEGELGNRTRAGKRQQASLTAPAQPGAYEIRYVLYEGARTVGRLPIAVLKSDVSVQAPEQVSTGERFSVSWSEAINPDDFMTIVPLDAPESALANRTRVRGNHTQGTLTAPAEPGMYEVRYVMREGGQVLARTPIDVIAAQATVSAPESVTAGSRFTVKWSETVNQNDFVAIAPRDAPASEISNRIRTGKNRLEASLTAPAQAGDYEVRYVLYEGAEVLASAALSVVAPEVTLDVPGEVVGGSRFDVRWSATVNQNDFVTIVSADAPATELGNRTRTGRNRTQAALTAPVQAGDYEVRYILSQGGEVLASVPVSVIEPVVQLTAPPKVRVQERFDVSWSETINPSDTVTLVPVDASQRTIGPRTRAGNRLAGNLTAPAEPGVYEVRYILQQGGEVLARQKIEVLSKDAPL